MKLPFLKKKPAEPSAIPMTKQQIIPKGVSSHVRTREEIYTQARLKTELDEPALPISPEVTAFLQRHGQAPEQLDMAALTASFRSAMEAGLRGEGGLPMMPTYLSDAGTLPGETPVAVLDAGGTHLRAAVVSTHNGSTLVTQSETLPLPGSKAPVSWEDFIAASVDLLEPRLDEVRHIGVCFCYPAEATPEHDLRVQTMTKEVRISGCEGQLVCASLAAELKRRGRTGFTFTALNDTAAALLLGKTTIPPRYASGFAGMVMGTGMNTCCVLPAERIPKLGQSEAGARMLVNLESGSFTDVPQGDFDRALDAASENPGAYLFEKMISGRYLGELCRLALAAAAEEGLFSSDAAEKLRALETLSSETADRFAADPACGAIEALAGTSEQDRAIAREIITALFRRAARAVTANVVALVLLVGKPVERYKPLIICVDGSLYNNSLLMHDSIADAMRDFALQEMGVYSVCKGVEQATLTGTAAAALLHQS